MGSLERQKICKAAQEAEQQAAGLQSSNFPSFRDIINQML